MNAKANDMTRGTEWKLILVFAIPVMLGNLLQQLYSAVDGIIVGKFVGEAALSAVGTTQSITFLCTSIAMGLGVGASIMTSQYFGAGRKDDIPLVVDTSLILSGSVGIIVSILGIIFSRFLLGTVLNVPDNLLGDASIYFQIYCAAMLFTFIYNAIAAILRGLGDSKATLYFLLTSTILNVFLDLLFVAVFKWAVIGAAVATSIAQAICAIVSFLYLRRRIKANNGKHFDKASCGVILRLGVPAAIQQSVVSFGHMAMQRLVNGFGQYSIAAYTAGNRIDNFMFVPIMGMSTAMSNFTGQNMGAGQLDRIKKGLRFTILANLTIAVTISVLLYVFATPVISLFSLSGESLARGIEQVRFVTLFFWCFSLYMGICGLLQGSGDVIAQSLISFTTLAVRVILGYIGVALHVLDYEAAWVTMPIGWVVAVLLAVFRYARGTWKKKAVAGSLANEEK